SGRDGFPGSARTASRRADGGCRTPWPQVVEQFHPRRADGPGQSLFVQLPGQIRGAALAVDDRAGHAEAARARRRPAAVLQVGCPAVLEGSIVPAVIRGGADLTKAAARFLVVRNHGFRAADVGGKNHGASLPEAFAPVEAASPSGAIPMPG